MKETKSLKFNYSPPDQPLWFWNTLYFQGLMVGMYVYFCKYNLSLGPDQMNRFESTLTVTYWPKTEYSYVMGSEIIFLKEFILK